MYKAPVKQSALTSDCEIATKYFRKTSLIMYSTDVLGFI